MKFVLITGWNDAAGDFETFLNKRIVTKDLINEFEMIHKIQFQTFEFSSIENMWDWMQLNEYSFDKIDTQVTRLFEIH